MFEQAEILKYISPEILILIPVLIVLGAMLKATPKVEDWMIPYIVGVVGMILATLTFGIQMGFTLEAYLRGVTQGFLAAGAAVYLHQLKLQYGNRNEENRRL